MAQWKRTGLITQRSGDRNPVLLFFQSCRLRKIYFAYHKTIVLSGHDFIKMLWFLKEPLVLTLKRVIISCPLALSIDLVTIEKIKRFLVWDNG